MSPAWLVSGSKWVPHRPKWFNMSTSRKAWLVISTHSLVPSIIYQSFLLIGKPMVNAGTSMSGSTPIHIHSKISISQWIASKCAILKRRSWNKKCFAKNAWLFSFTASVDYRGGAIRAPSLWGWGECFQENVPQRHGYMYHQWSVSYDCIGWYSMDT